MKLSNVDIVTLAAIRSRNTAEAAFWINKMSQAFIEDLTGHPNFPMLKKLYED